MSDDSIPAPDDRYKHDIVFEAKRVDPEDILFPLGVRRRGVRAANEPSPTPAAKPRRPQKPAADSSTHSPIDHILHSLQTFGFTHPSTGHFLMVPKEFQAILLRETKAVAAVVWEIMQQTIGWEGSGTGGRREWAPLTVRYFERAKLLSRTHAAKGIKQALKKRYIERRQRGACRYEYRLRWKGTN
jgi:hypothetical protein